MLKALLVLFLVLFTVATGLVYDRQASTLTISESTGQAAEEAAAAEAGRDASDDVPDGQP